MAAINALVSYDSESDSEENESAEEKITPDHTAHLSTDVSISKLQSKIQLKSAPEVTAKVSSSISVVCMYGVHVVTKPQITYLKLLVTYL